MLEATTVGELNSLPDLQTRLARESGHDVLKVDVGLKRMVVEVLENTCDVAGAERDHELVGLGLHCEG